MSLHRNMWGSFLLQLDIKDAHTSFLLFSSKFSLVFKFSEKKWCWCFLTTLHFWARKQLFVENCSLKVQGFGFEQGNQMENVFVLGKFMSSTVTFFWNMDVVAKLCSKIMLEFNIVKAKAKIAPLCTLLVTTTWRSTFTSIDQNLSVCAITNWFNSTKFQSTSFWMLKWTY